MSEIWNLSTLCRCCHVDGLFKSLNAVYQGKNGVEVYETILQETLGLTISSPPLQASYTICDICIRRLQDAKEFKDQVLMCEKRFRIYCSNELHQADVIKHVEIKTNEIKEEMESDNEKGDGHQNDGDDNSNKKCIEVKLELKVVNLSDAPAYKIESTKNTKDKLLKIQSDTKNVAPVKTLKPTDVKKKPVKRKNNHNSTETKSNEQNVTVKELKTNAKLKYECKECSKVFSSKKLIKAHVISHQLNKHSYKCKQCDKSFQQEKCLIKHLANHKILCNHCHQWFESTKSFETHLNRAMYPKEFQCDICQKYFRKKITVLRHLKWHAGTLKTRLCDLCGKAFNDVTNLRKHIDTVHKRLRPFECKLCAKAFATMKTWKIHTQRHVNKITYKCDKCAKEFASKTSFKIHRLTHDGKFKCRICSVIFDDQTAKLLHMETHDIVKPRKMMSPCEICGKVLSTKHSLNRHLNIHNGLREFECDVCGLNFAQKTMLKRHLYRKHTEKGLSEKGKCSYCNKMFPIYNLKSHEINVHIKPKFACDICGKRYAENNTLTRHKLVKHFGRTYDCDVCGKKYVQRRAVVKHKLKAHQIKCEVDDVGNANIPAFVSPSSIT